jgi:cobalt-zinc-cadmium efflux system membrane fusion protein
MKLISNVIILLAACTCVAMVGCGKSGDSAGQSADGRCSHEIKQERCPFCNPEMVAAEGFCGEHGVAEALCTKCRPYLNAAFRAKGDWCAEHNTPESQCIACNPELEANVKPGVHGGAAPTGSDAGDCEHGIASSKCPFCTPSLVETAGYCKEHEIAEALCVQCRPYLKTAFMAKGDWCAEHDTPESQCLQCNPSLDRSNQGGG